VHQRPAAHPDLTDLIIYKYCISQTLNIKYSDYKRWCFCSVSKYFCYTIISKMFIVFYIRLILLFLPAYILIIIIVNIYFETPLLMMHLPSHKHSNNRT